MAAADAGTHRTEASAPASRTHDVAARPVSSSSAGRTAVRGPTWRELSAGQQKALAPLGPHWNGMTETQKRKWIALSRDFESFTPAEQATLHSRMTDWAALSAQDRVRARHAFAEIRRIPLDERKAKWEAYQALPAEERSKFAEKAARAPGAAVAIEPVPSQRLVKSPPAAQDGRQPRIQLSTAAPASAPTRPAVRGPSGSGAESPATGSPTGGAAR